MAVGETKDAGWEIGVSRTVPYPVPQVWQLLTENPDIWLGSGTKLPAEVGEQWSAADGTRGELRSRRDGDRIRLTWRPADWTHDSTVQVAVVERDGRTSIRFHQERLTGPDERGQQQAHWTAVLDRVIEALGREWSDAGDATADPDAGAPAAER